MIYMCKKVLKRNVVFVVLLSLCSIFTPAKLLATPQPEIKQIEFQGNTVFSDQALSNLVEEWIGKQLTIPNLLMLRSAITDYYVNQGYITSAAYVPEQSITDGVVIVQVVEGTLENVQVTGIKSDLTRSYIETQLVRGISTPIHQRDLVKQLQRLQQEPIIDEIEAELIRGNGDGQSQLNLDIKLALSRQIQLQAGNRQNPNLGVWERQVGLTDHNLIGFGDQLDLTYSQSEGVDLWSVNYRLPFVDQGGDFSVGYRQNTVAVVNNFDGVDVSSVADTFSLEYRQELVRDGNEELAVGIGLDWRQSQTYLDNEPFPFNLGTLETNGQSRVRPLRLNIEYLRYGVRDTFFARSRVSLGLDWFNATDNELNWDGDFLAWLGSVQYLRQLSEDQVLSTELILQLTPDPLLPLEQIAIGGVNSVRGFENQSRSGDNGALFSVEWRWALSENLTLVPFWDSGVVWNNDLSEIDGINRNVLSPHFLSSVGLGVTWKIGTNWEVQGDLGIPLINDADEIQQLGTVQLFYRSAF
jgi:hemolysin activation/secretion protein